MLKFPSNLINLRTFVVLFTFNLLSCGQAVDFRIAIFDWSSVDSTNEIWDGKYTQGVSANFFLAVEHFNARRIDIIPALAEVQNCNKNITVVQFCETGGNPLRGLADVKYVLEEFTPRIHAIAGLGGVDDSISGSLLAEASGQIPVISHWVTAPRLSNKHIFPRYARTCVSDNDHALVTANLMNQLKFKTVILIYLSDGKDFASQFARELKRFNIQLRSFEFEYTDTIYSESIDEAVASASKLELNAIVVASWAAQLTLLANAFSKNNMLTPVHSFYLTYLDRDPAPSEFIASPNLYNFISGAIRVARVVDPALNGNWKRHLEHWPTYEALYREKINAFLPPHGLNNSLECKNSNFKYQLPVNYFLETVQLANEVWAQSYDTVLAYGMAVCRLSPTGTNIPTGPEIYAQLLKSSFSGMSSPHFQFSETGDPDINAAGFRLVNYIPIASQQMQLVYVASLQQDTLEFDINYDNITFRGGKGSAYLPKDIVPPVHNENLLPLWAVILGLVQVSILFIMGAICALWLLQKRQEKVVVNSQVPLMWMIVFGSMIAASAIIPLLADDVESTLNADICCMLTPVLFILGFQITTVAISVKVYCIYTVFHNPKSRKYQVPLRKFLCALIGGLAIPIFIVALWWGIMPLKYIRVIVFQDSHSNPIESFGMCDASTPFSGAMLILLFICYGISLIGVVVVAYKVRSVSSDYHEAKWIALAVVSQCQIFFIAIPTIAAVYRFVLGRFILISMVIFASVFMILASIFLPKMRVTWTGKDIPSPKTNQNCEPIAELSRLDLDVPSSTLESSNQIGKISLL